MRRWDRHVGRPVKSKWEFHNWTVKRPPRTVVPRLQQLHYYADHRWHSYKRQLLPVLVAPDSSNNAKQVKCELSKYSNIIQIAVIKYLPEIVILDNHKILACGLYPNSIERHDGIGPS